MKTKCTKILIAEWIPSLNKGELAILIGTLKTFKRLGTVEVSIFSCNPAIDTERYPKGMKLVDVGKNLHLGNSLIGRSKWADLRVRIFPVIQHFFFALLYKIFGKNTLKFMRNPLWLEYCRSDAIIVCHDQVDCVFGFILPYSPVYITLFAKALHKPVIIYANGSPLYVGRLWKILASFVLNNVDLITVRDKMSFLYLQQFVRDKNRIHLTGDPAILLPPANVERIAELMRREKLHTCQGLLVGATMSREVLLKAFPKEVNPSIRYQKALTAIAQMFDRLIEGFQATIIFVPHCIEQYDNRDDRVVAKEIYTIIKNKDKVKIIFEEYSPEDLKGLIGKFDIFVTTRIHSAIGALSMNVPSCIIAKSSDSRAYGLIGELLKQEEWVYNVECLDADSLFMRVRSLLSFSDKIRESLPPIVESAREKAYLNADLLKILLDSRSNIHDD